MANQGGKTGHRTPGVKCSVCNVFLPNQTQIDVHFAGKKHWKNQSKFGTNNKDNKVVFISRLGNLKLSSLHTYLSQFGTVCNMIVRWDYQTQSRMHSVTVEFEAVESVNRIISNEVRYQHKVPVSDAASSNYFQKIQVCKHRVQASRPREPSPPPAPTISYSEMKLQLSLNFELDSQMEEVVLLTELTQQDIDHRNTLCSNIRKTFARSGYPECVVSPFGSTVNGLGFRGCDLDVYLDLGPIPWVQSASNPLLEVPVNLTEVQKVRLAAKLLREIPQCTKIFPIASARVPIVKFVHRESGIHCDISFRNRASVLNSEFIRFCTELDSRVRPVMMAVRLIFKMYDVSGGGGGSRISNYALTMLVIFYLQQLEKPILYSVYTLQQYLETDESKEVINGWNSSFCTNPSKIPPLPVNKQGLFELLAGFFSFYSQLDFTTLLLSPHLGQILDRQQLGQVQEFAGQPSFLGSSGMDLDKPVCVQDPFELSHNVCKNLPLKALQSLMALFRQLDKACQLLIKPDVKIPGGFNTLLELDLEPETVSKEQLVQPLIPNLTTELIKVTGAKLYLGLQLPLPSLRCAHEYIQTVFSTCFKFDKIDGEDSLVPKVAEAHNSKDETVTQIEETAKDTAVEKTDNMNTERPAVYINEINSTDIIVDQCQNASVLDSPTTPKKDTVMESSTDPSTDIEAVAREFEDSKTVSMDLKRRFVEELSSTKHKKAKVEEDSNLIVEAWSVKYQVWAGRKKLASEIKDPLSTLEMEARITEEVISKEIPSDVSVIQFRSYLTTVQDVPCLGLEMISSRKNLYQNLFTWLSSCVPDLVKKLQKESEPDRDDTKTSKPMHVEGETHLNPSI